MRSAARTLVLLLTLAPACVINTRPHLPLVDDGGRAAFASDASASLDAGAPLGLDASAVSDLPLTDSAPPTAIADAGLAGDTDTASERNDCLPADADRADGGDAGARGDGGDAGFTNAQGHPCDPATHRRDGGASDASDASDSSYARDGRGGR